MYLLKRKYNFFKCLLVTSESLQQTHMDQSYKNKEKIPQYKTPQN